MKRVINKFVKKMSRKSFVEIIFLSFLLSPLASFAAPLFYPGQTLNPSCLPTNPDCTVSTTTLPSSIYPSFTYASSTFPSFTYASTTYYLASNPAGYLTAFSEADPIWLAASTSYAKLSGATFTGSVSVDAGNSYNLNGVALAYGSTTLNNYFFGGAGNSTMTGYANTANGFDSFSSNTNGSRNTAGGFYSLNANTEGYNNTANGFDSLANNTTGVSNTANGSQSLYYNTTGNFNTASGDSSLDQNTTGNYNTANGVYSLNSNTTGNYNTANGVYSLNSNSTGNYNTANGVYSLYSNTTGSNNVALGYLAGNYSDDSNSLYIDNQNRGSSSTERTNGLIYGKFNANPALQTLTFNANIGIGTTNPSQKLDVAGNINVSDGSAYMYNGQNIIIASTTLQNYFFGGAGNVTMTGGDNTAIGLGSLINNTTGFNNNANGYLSLSSNTVGSNNTANGVQSLFSNTTGVNNTANGSLSLNYNTTGSGNTANGNSTLSSNTTGFNNVANGSNSLYLNTTGSYNTANGYYSMYSNTTGSDNTANGNSSLLNNTTGSTNVANGESSLYSNTTGNNNVANGGFSLNQNTFGSQNTANGYQSLYSNTTGISNTANGANALYLNTTGFGNTANGYQSLYNSGKTVTVDQLVAGVYYTIQYSGDTDFVSLGATDNNIGTEFTYNGLVTGTGTGRASSNTGYNSANGWQALYSNTSGSQNTANGAQALYFNNTGNDNVANGANALLMNTDGYGNTADGVSSLMAVHGNQNVALGKYAGAFQSDGTTSLTFSDQSLYIGAGSMGFDNNDRNSIVIGYNAKGIGANTVVLGNDDISTTALKGNVGIGTTTPTAALTISSTSTTLLRLVGFGAGALNTDSNGNVTNSSDERLKDIQGSYDKGLADIEKINPIDYKWKESTGYDTSNVYTGFSAQNMQLAIPEAVGENAAGYLTLSDRPIIAALVNSVKQIGSFISKVEGGIAYLKNIVVEKFTVGSNISPAGITMYDRTTKQPYCVSVNNGVLVNEQGECSTEMPNINNTTSVGSSGDNMVVIPTEQSTSTTSENASTTVSDISTSTIETISTSTPEVAIEPVSTSTDEVVSSDATTTDEVVTPEVTTPIEIYLAPEATSTEQ